jgi:superfamily II DNA or RNA helicase
MKIKVNNLFSEIKTDNYELLLQLMDLYSIFSPGYEYTFAFKDHKWDGKKKFINKKGHIRTGLLDRLLTDLEAIGCTPEIIQEESKKSLLDSTLKDLTYFPFQERLIEKALSKKRCVVESPTGSGKTLIMAGICQALRDKQITILFNSKQILKQTYDFFKKYTDFEEPGICFGEGFVDGNPMLSTVQSIKNILDPYVGDSEALLIDEAHEFCKGKVTLPAMESFPKADYRYGFTATPPTDMFSLFNLEGALGPVIKDLNASELVNKGLLAEPLIQIIDVKHEELFTSVVDSCMTYKEVYKTYIVENEHRNNIIRDLVKVINDRSKPSKVLIIVKDLDHADILEKKIRDIGLEVYKLVGENTIVERYEVIDKFTNSKNCSILIGTKIFQTGVNIESISHFINARSLKSEQATIQALGRALRKHKSKAKVYIYDFYDHVHYLNDHSDQRISHYKKQGHILKEL